MKWLQEYQRWINKIMKTEKKNQTTGDQELREVTFGEKLVGLDFNPSNKDEVVRAKQLCADLANIVIEHYQGRESTILYDKLYNHTIGEILNAQMNVVKLLTFKY